MACSIDIIAVDRISYVQTSQYTVRIEWVPQRGKVTSGAEGQIMMMSFMKIKSLWT